MSWVDAGDYGLTSSPTVDNSSALQSALNAAAGSVLVIPPGEYGCAPSSPLRLSAGTTVLAHGVVLHGLTGRRAMVCNYADGDTTTTGYDGRSGITWVGGVFDAHGDTVTATSGNIAAMNHARDITFRDVTFRRVRSYHALELNAIDGAKVEGCTFEGWADDGTHPRKEAIQVDCALSGSISSGAYDGTMTRNVVVSNNTLRGFGSLDAAPVLVGSHSAPSGAYFDNIRVVGNDAQGSQDAAVRAYRWRNFVVVGNTLTGCGGSAVRASECVNGDIGPNAITTTGAVGYQLLDCDGVRRHGRSVTYDDTGIVTAATGWDVTTESLHESGDECTLRVVAKRTGAAVPVQANGNIYPDETIGTVAADYWPALGTGGAQCGGGSLPGVQITTGGEVRLTSVAPGTVIAPSTYSTAFTITYSRAT